MKMAQQHKITGRATNIQTTNGNTVIRYHATDVVSFNAKEIVLNSGGWRTATTKTRMNQAAGQFDLGYSVFQKDFDWFVDYRGLVVGFEDNMRLQRG
jgi:hypothetical protein